MQRVTGMDEVSCLRANTAVIFININVHAEYCCFVLCFGQEVNGGVLNVAEGGRVRFKSRAYMHDVEVQSVTEDGTDFTSDQWFGGCIYNNVRRFSTIRVIYRSRARHVWYGNRNSRRRVLFLPVSPLFGAWAVETR